MNVQVFTGRRLGGLPKKTETFIFFQIDSKRVQDFRKQLATLIPLITTTAQVIKDKTKIGQTKGDSNKTGLLKLSGVNIAFSQKGLVQVGSLFLTMHMSD